MRVILLSFVCLAVANASVVGLSTHPFSVDNKIITTEFDNYLSSEGGMGVTAKYYQKINRQINLDAGVGATSGDRESRVFVGADYELFPDYAKQPRISMKGVFESVSLEGDRINTFAIAPTLSKGILISKTEAFPFVALPIGVSLNADTNTYETTTSLAAGLTRRFKLNGTKDIVANFETNIDLRNSYSAVVLGVSLPLQ